MNDHPLVSIIMPVYNAELYVAEALESAFAQTYKNIEVICVNDGSTDKSFEVLQSFGDRIVLLNNEKNCGIGQTRNNAIAVARGDFLAFMDADDLWEPEKLQSQMDQFQNDPNLDMSFTHMKCFISPELPDEIKRLRYVPPDAMPAYMSGSAVVKTDSFKKVGMFNPEWRVGEFIDWSAKAKEARLKSGILPGIFLLRRIHNTNTGVTERPSRGDYLRIVKEALDRKKRQQ